MSHSGGDGGGDGGETAHDDLLLQKKGAPDQQVRTRRIFLLQTRTNSRRRNVEYQSQLRIGHPVAM